MASTSAWNSSATSNDEDNAAFLQSRVATAGVVMGDGFLIFLVFRAIPIVFFGQYDRFIDPSFLLHGVTAAVFFSMWVVLRLEGLSVRAIRFVETAGLLGGAFSTILMGAFIPLGARPDFIILSSMTIGFFARSVWVPSSARRTALLGLAIGLPMVATMYALFLGVDVESWLEIGEAPLEDTATPYTIASSVAIWLTVWWTVATGTAASASRVFYGLRKQVHDAKQLGQYKLERKLGEGGMGMVFRATHGMLRRPTAVKLLLPEKAGEHNLARFEREVQLTATLTHPNTATIFDYGRTPDGVFYYAMELLEGATLQAIVELHLQMPEARVLRILEQSTGALAEAHGRGLIHRDIKPSNIMLCRHGGRHDMVKVLDFGLVKQLNAGSNSGLTQTESLTGTPQYMSPEAISDPDSIDARSDIYSLGCVAYYLLTGRHVFSGNNIVEVCGHHLHTDPAPPSTVTDNPISPALERLVLQCLAKSPDARPAGGRELLRVLEGIELPSVWKESDASEWWDEYQLALRSQLSSSSVDTNLQTIDIDMERRRAASGSAGTEHALH